MITAERPGETEAQRNDRNLVELLQELRVAAVGVQVIFGFLLSLPFYARFSALGHAQRVLYLVAVVLSVVSAALLLGPVAYHRLVFRRHQKHDLVRAANVMAIAGLAAVALTVVAAVLLVVSFVEAGLTTVLVTVFTAGLFGGLWFVYPLIRRRDWTTAGSGPSAPLSAAAKPPAPHLTPPANDSHIRDVGPAAGADRE
jgi:Family of unknown function (DUF6328)